MKRLLFLAGTVLLLSGCGEQANPLFTREAGMWETKLQLLTPPSAFIPAEQRNRMRPEDFARLQAEAARPVQMEPPACIDAGQVYAEDLSSLIRVPQMRMNGCTITRNERSGTGYALAGTCPVNSIDVPMEMSGSGSPTEVTSEISIGPVPPQAGEPATPAVRMRITQRRIGDCPGGQ